MARQIKYNYVKGIIICHGKSELQLARYTTTNLHLNILTFSRNNGKTSIQITSLMDVLNSLQFSTIEEFQKNYIVETTGKGKKIKLKDFKLFIIMDTDDCTEQQKNDYINKNMFSGHWAKEHIVPIYNMPSLEKTMQDCGIMTTRISRNEKGDYYTKIFPINTQPLSDDTINQITTLAEKVRPCKSTNLEVLLDYCLSLCNG